MKLIKVLGQHVHPMMLVIPFGLLGIEPALTLMFIAFALVVIVGWLGDELVKRLGMGLDPQAGDNPTGGVGGGPTRW